MIIINYISNRYAHEYANEGLVCITNMHLNDFSNGLFTVRMIFFFAEYGSRLFEFGILANHYLIKKT